MGNGIFLVKINEFGKLSQSKQLESITGRSKAFICIMMKTANGDKHILFFGFVGNEPWELPAACDNAKS